MPLAVATGRAFGGPPPRSRPLRTATLPAPPDWPEKRIIYDAAAVRERLAKIVNDDDLRRYIL